MTTQVLENRYEIQQQLGKRAGRRTLLARDLQTKNLVVIKLLSFGSDFEWDDLKLFEREAQTLKSLSHPAIPRYLDYFELDSPSGKKFALVQSYVEGKSLEEHLQAGRTFSEAEVKQMAKALLEILIYLHGRQPPVIHRDIKPSNILLHNRSGNRVGEVYLVDFGSVQTLVAQEGGTMTVVGTYGYMPQEQFGGRTVLASDLYSLGATLIYLVTGTHPADLPQKNFRIQFEQACNLSPAISSWLRWMTEPMLDQRLPSAREALQVLEQKQLTRDSTPLVVRKPTGSKVLFTQDADRLEITLPRSGFYSKDLPSGERIVDICTMIFFLMGMAPVISMNGLNSWYVLGWLLILAFFGISIFWAVSKQVKLCINREKISLTHELFGFKLNHPRPAARQAITRLEYLHYVIKNPKTRASHIKPRIIIWTGTQKYEIGSNNSSVTEPELDWLAHELSEWLGMPIVTQQRTLADS